MLLDDFKTHCLSLKPDVLVQKYLIESETFFFNEVKKGEEFEFKKEIASILDVHVRDIVVVGSAKLGFSLKPAKDAPGLYLFREFDFAFKNSPENEKSDIDVAIVSSPLFDKEIKNLYDYTGYYKNPPRERNSLAQYVLKGRLATRYFPNDFPLTQEILNVQEKYQRNYGRTVNLEIYKSWYFFETYHQENIKNIYINLIR